MPGTCGRVCSPRRLAPALLTALVVAGCGGGNVGAGPAEPTASAPDATAPPADATQPGTGPLTTTPPARTGTEPDGASGTGGAAGATDDSAAGGGAQDVRVPAAFVAIARGRLRPPTITVPPFLAVELSLRSADGRPHRLVVATPTPHMLAVAASRRASIRIPGLRAGRYAVTLDGRRVGALVAGGEVGP
jgi:hypothetical protein